MIHPARIQLLNERGVLKGRYVLYWMQASQRASFNHALEYAIDMANHLDVPLVAFFGVTKKYPNANLRHYRFMLEGLVETRARFERRGIRLVIQKIDPDDGCISMAQEACAVIADRGYTRVQRLWRARASDLAACRMVQVESDAIVPVTAASQKQEYSAATIRPKIARLLKTHLVPLKNGKPKRSSIGLKFDEFDIDDLDAACAELDIDHSVAPSTQFRGGASQAKKLLDDFVDRKLSRYAVSRNDPTLDGVSCLSPYLHFGQISPLEIALAVRKKGGRGAKEFLEELIVRRELAINYVFYNPHYDSFEGLPAWARATLDEHSNDRREYVYTREELENARTHDTCWNAAQREMILTGKMHGYMRMYWGKKILEWMRDPRDAFAAAAYLNDRYELDGRDPNGYAGIAWCFGLHDRPWAGRPIFGNVRYMNDKGLRRKFDVDGYVRKIGNIQA